MVRRARGYSSHTFGRIRLASKQVVQSIKDMAVANAAERINLAITDNGGALCDRCISAQLGQNQTQHAQQITQALATTSEFTREDGKCAICGRWRKVTSRT